jgi:DeoR family transcriptional regulator, fructose operon transcriptional repressor
MNFQERKRLILKSLEDKPSMDVKSLSKALKVSEITIRRDLNILSEKGLIYRTHGGAMNPAATREEIAFSNKAAVHPKEKEYIAKLASSYIKDGDTVFMDCGSTVFAMVPFIRHKRIKVITNSFPLVSALSKSEVSINLIGGEFNYERMAIHGKIALEHIKRYHAEIAFLGVDGISLTNGLSSNSEFESEITTAMANASERVFLLCDSSKFERDKYLAFAPLSTIRTIITDGNLKPALLTRYRKAGVEIVNSEK